MIIDQSKLCYKSDQIHTNNVKCIWRLPVNFHSNYSSSWTNYELDYLQCHPLHSPSKIPNDVASFVAVWMDLYLHVVVVFVVEPFSVVLAVVCYEKKEGKKSIEIIQEPRSTEKKKTKKNGDKEVGKVIDSYRCLLICIYLCLRLIMLTVDIIGWWTGRWLILKIPLKWLWYRIRWR